MKEREKQETTPLPPSSPPLILRQAVMAAFMYLASILLLPSTQWGEDGVGGGWRGGEGVLTCRRVVLNSAALERQTGRGEERVTKRRRGEMGGGRKNKCKDGDKRRRKSGVKG